MSAGTSPDERESSRVAMAEYIAVEMSRLARLADANRFGLLAYLIDMAVLEAWREANGDETGAPDSAADR